MNRRKFTKIIATLGGASALTGLYAWRIEPFRLEFVNEYVGEQPAGFIARQMLMQISDMRVALLTGVT
ncbi:hypothetical protein U0035_16115 [Niabella yanshanensis]|uniref:Uncharacterized protein n=1 Tax=Niabella yanshanensis TaxID=577386 RepID=A0ABZ0W5A2_9BACT|nr:hypothetical protein [Niabella yanshanensis]WQD37195.1 hypothetical protein U0035_16115 [Niabella yanshanensis]